MTRASKDSVTTTTSDAVRERTLFLRFVCMRAQRVGSKIVVTAEKKRRLPPVCRGWGGAPYRPPCA